MNLFAHILVQGAQGSFHYDFIADDIEPVAAVDTANRQNHRLLCVDPAAADFLKGADGFGRDNNGVYSLMRIRAMNFFAFYSNDKSVGCCHRWARVITDLTHVQG